jgi:hypothetical protein
MISSKLQDILQDSPKEAKLKQFFKRNGFVHYMTNRWQLDLWGKATIFVSRNNDMLVYSANFIVDGNTYQSKGFIMCKEINVDAAPQGLQIIVSRLESKYAQDS